MTISILQQPKVILFLNAIGINSQQSKRSYSNGLTQFQRYLDVNGQDTLETIIEKIKSGELDPYPLLSGFISFLLNQKLTNSFTVSGYMTAIRSYLGYFDIDIIPSKFKRRVKMPKHQEEEEDEEVLDKTDIRNILLKSENRLKPFLAVLASGASRAMETCAMRIKDVDFSVSPTKIHIRKEYAKTRKARYVLISDEATKLLKDWLDFKYRSRRGSLPIKSEDDLIFSKAHFGSDEETTPLSIYQKIRIDFNKVLKAINMDERKEGMKRRKITMHKIRAFVKTTVSDQHSTDYSEWFLGHHKSTYWKKKEPVKREIYATKCMKYLTFLDYSELEATGRSIEKKLEQKDKEVSSLNVEIKKLENEKDSMFSKIEELEKLQVKGQKETDERINKLMAMYSDPKVGAMKKHFIGLALAGKKEKKKDSSLG